MKLMALAACEVRLPIRTIASWRIESNTVIKTIYNWCRK